MACLAAIAVPALSLSVGSGSAFLGGAALFSFLSAQSSAAQDVDIPSDVSLLEDEENLLNEKLFASIMAADVPAPIAVDTPAPYAFTPPNVAWTRVNMLDLTDRFAQLGGTSNFPGYRNLGKDNYMINITGVTEEMGLFTDSYLLSPAFFATNVGIYLENEQRKLGGILYSDNVYFSGAGNARLQLTGLSANNYADYRLLTYYYTDDVYINGLQLFLGDDMGDVRYGANFHLGSTSYAEAGYVAFTNAVLRVDTNVSTDGYLDVQENTAIALRNGVNLSFDEGLQGSGDLLVAEAADSLEVAGATLSLGARLGMNAIYSGQLTLDSTVNLEIVRGVQQVGGIVVRGASNVSHSISAIGSSLIINGTLQIGGESTNERGGTTELNGSIQAQSLLLKGSQNQYETDAETVVNGNVVITGDAEIERGATLALRSSITTGSMTMHGGAILSVQANNVVTSEFFNSLRFANDASASNMAIVEWEIAGDASKLSGASFSDKLKLRINLSNHHAWSPWESLTVNGILELVQGEIGLTGTNNINKVSSPYEQAGRLTLDSDSVTTIRTNSSVGAWLDMRDNAQLTLGGSLETLGGGLHTQNATQDSPVGNASISSSAQGVSLTLHVVDNDNHMNGSGVEPEFGEGQGYVFCGSIDISGSLKKYGDKEQTILGSASFGQDVSVYEGTLRFKDTLQAASLHLLTDDSSELLIGGETTVSGDVEVNVGLLQLDGNAGIGGNVVINGGQVLAQGVTVIEQNVELNSGSLTFNAAGGGQHIIRGSVSGTGGSLMLDAAVLRIYGGGHYSGELFLQNASSLILDADMEIEGFSSESGVTAGGNSIRSMAADGAVLTINSVWVDSDNDEEEEEPAILKVGRGITFDSSLHLVKTGAGEQKLESSVVDGALTIEEGTLSFSGGASHINGELDGSGGMLQAIGSGVSLSINGGGEYGGVLSAQNQAQISLAAGLAADTLALSSGSLTLNDADLTVNHVQISGEGNQLSGSGRLIINLTEGVEEFAGDTELSISDGVVLEKAGDGMLCVYGLSSTGTVIVSGGTLEYKGGAFSVSSVQVGDGAIFAIGSDGADLSEAGVSLTGGAILHIESAAENTVIGSLTTEGEGNSILWDEGELYLTVNNLSGEGNLDVGNAGERLNLRSMTNFDGTLKGNVGKVYVGGADEELGALALHQDAGVVTSIEVDGGVFSKAFRKTGEGTLNITSLTVEKSADGSGGLWMNYEGELNIDDLLVEDGVVLYYSTGKSDHVLNMDVSSFYKKGIAYGLNVDAVEDDVLLNGICLGITSSTGMEDLNELMAQLTPMGAGSLEFSLDWVLGADGMRTLYMFVQRFDNPDNNWDPDWGVVTMTAPGKDLMATHAIEADDVAWLDRTSGTAQNFMRNSLVLSASESGAYHGGAYGEMIYISDGPKQSSTTTWATVMGGNLYMTGEAGRYAKDTWIYLSPGTQTANFHMLLGGSSCYTTVGSSEADPAGYVGSSHIQVEGGTIDYIVGGNHMTNAAFVFEGNSYIAVFNGSVRGSIVGGSTVTRAFEGVKEFVGSTRITVHNVLSNSANTPTISLPSETGAGAYGSAFTAIVGGNAWVGFPAGATDRSLSFQGSSYIMVDLASEVGSEIIRGSVIGNFDKAIVGGNYTAFVDGGECSTSFSPNPESSAAASTIIIRATDAAVFTAGVNGASRRSSIGGGTTSFRGNTSLSIEGGTFSEAVAGAFWFDSATASTPAGNHKSDFTGNTRVNISGGNIWRVVGANYSLGAGTGSEESFVGNSDVMISGGHFSSSHGVSVGNTQMDMSFVVGGSFYRNSAGSANTHTGGTAGVSITGGEFDGVHIVGGDYVNSSVAAGCSASIEGGSYVRIGGELTSNDAVVRGLVVGGSYLTDEKSGGSITVSSSEVVIGDHAILEAEFDADSGEYRHGGVAVVAGSVIMDEGAESGGHSAIITEGTHLLVSGGSVKGHLVGGNYANASDQRNSLSVAGASSIELLGGSISGNVYGGHFSDNETSPDALSMGSVSITVDGAEVTGNIVGGSYRGVSAALPGNDHPVQGAVGISLLSGRLIGHVYAAGWHENADSRSLSAVADSTYVRLSAAMEFGAAPVGEDDDIIEDSTIWTISGGYYKASDSDVSSISGAAVLEFVGNSAFDNLSHVIFRDFDTVSLNTNVTLLKDQFRVLDRGTNGVFTKNGSGMLTLAGGLCAADGGAYAGAIQVNNGILALGESQKLDAGIGFNLNSRRSANSIATAYLQAVDGAQLTAAKGTKVEIVAKNLTNGTYYLTGPLTGVAGLSAEDIFDWAGSALNWDNSIEDADSYKYELKLKDDCLVLRVHVANPDKWYWEGDEDLVWYNDSTKNWSRQGDHVLTKDDDVYFNAGALDGNVSIMDRVTPRNVYVQSGEFVFTQHPESVQPGGLSMQANGSRLVVGSGEADRTARLTLMLLNDRIPIVDLQTGGTLVLAHRAALSAITSIEFNGGVLAYGEDPETGYLYAADDDLSRNISANSMGIVRVQVGSADTAELSSKCYISWGDENTLRYSTESIASEGFNQILSKGIEKSGRGVLSLRWTETTESYAQMGAYTGSISVLGGQLTMHVQNETGGDLALDPSSSIGMAEGGVLQFIAQSAAGNAINTRLDISRDIVNVSGAPSDAEEKAKVIIGSSEPVPQTQSNYRLSGNNAAFSGVIELRGRLGVRADSVRVRNADSLGGENTTLMLSGRNIVMEARSSGTVINAGEVHVSDNTVNFLGYAEGEELTVNQIDTALAWSASNKSITITGALTGSGAIANSRGDTRNGLSGYTHTISGDISGFTGLIVAGSSQGLVTTGSSGYSGESSTTFQGAYSSSSWTLTGDAPDAIRAAFGGYGSIIVAYDELGEAGLLIEGRIGHETHGNWTRLENRSNGKLIIGSGSNTTLGALIFNGNVIQLGDDEHSANWAGSVLRQGADNDAEQSSAFVLANGSLSQAFDEAGLGGVLLQVDTAANARVNVAQTHASLFDEIAVRNGGRLSGVDGDIIVGPDAGQVHKLVLGFDKNSVGTTTGVSGDYLINSNGGDIDLSLVLTDEETAAQHLVFDFDNESFKKVLILHRESEARTYLHVLAGGGELLLGETGEDTLQNIFSGSHSNASILTELGFKYMGTEQGDIIMSGSSKEVYLVLGGENEWKGDSHEVFDYDILNKYKATVIDEGETLTISVHYKELGDPDPGTDADGLHINNLVGLEGSILSLQNSSWIEYLDALADWEQSMEKWMALSPEEKNLIPPPVRPDECGDVVFVLDNSSHVMKDGWALPNGVATDDVKGVDTYFEGSIVAEDGVNIRKTGRGTLYVGMEDGSSGGITLNGELRLEEGGLAIRGTESQIASFVFAYAGSGQEPNEDRALTVHRGTLTISDSLTAEGDYTVDDHIRIEYGGELVYSGKESLLHNLSISSDTKDGIFTVQKVDHPLVEVVDEDGVTTMQPDERIGKLTLENTTISNVKLHVIKGELTITGWGSEANSGEVSVVDGRLNITDEATLKAGVLHMAGEGVVDISNTTGNTVRELTGDGILQGAFGGELTYLGDKSSTFSGTLLGTLPEEDAPAPVAEDGQEPAQASLGAKLIINEGSGTLTFQDVSSSSDAKWDILNNGKWVINAPAGKAINVGELTLSSTSSTLFIYNPNFKTGVFDADSVSWERGAKLDIESSDDSALKEKRILLGFADEMDGDRLDVDITLRGLPFLHYTAGDIDHDQENDGAIYLGLNSVDGNAFYHSGMHKNAKAGADFFWAVTDGAAYDNLLSNKQSDMYKISRAISYMERGSAELDRTLAAGAGSSTSVLGSALSQDLQRQLTAIRNRTTTMGADPGYDRFSEKPLYHVWLNGESSYHKLSADGLAPGFSLSSWGGTVGVDAALSHSTTIGLAVSAMYGNLKADAADHAEGDMDTTYVSIFARKAHGAWLHTFIMSGGIADVTLNRTVNYGVDSYRTKGNTDGSVLGAMYELGYSKVLKADASAILQTVFNVELRHAQIAGYTEKGSDAGVKVDDIEHTVLTFGAGVRAQAVVGANAYNRSSILEGRMLVKFDAGDRSGTAITKLANGADVSAEVESAEIGAMGIEIGAGLTIPMGVQSSLFIDASAEFRSGYTNMDATIGYRVSF